MARLWGRGSQFGRFARRAPGLSYSLYIWRLRPGAAWPRIISCRS